MSPYLRTVKTSSGATAVQIVHSSHRGSRDIEHLGSAHTAAEVELLKAAGWQNPGLDPDAIEDSDSIRIVLPTLPPVALCVVALDQIYRHSDGPGDMPYGRAISAIAIWGDPVRGRSGYLHEA